MLPAHPTAARHGPPNRLLLVHLTLLLLATALLVMPAPTHGAEPLRINTASVEPFVTKDGDGFLDLLVAEVFKRVGKQALINSYRGASARSLTMANNGTDDGEALRIKGQEKNFPNLIRVPEPMLINRFVAYSRPGQGVIANWADLRPHSIGFVQGWWIFQKNTTDVPRITTVNNAGQLFSMLNLNRVDVVLYEMWQGLWIAHANGIAVKVHDPPLAQVEMFMYLHNRHEQLVPRVAEALAAMKADGTYQAIMDRVLRPLLPTT